MTIENYAFGIQFDTNKFPTGNAQRHALSLLFSRITEKDIPETAVAAGFPYEDKPNVFIVVFHTVHYKTARKIFLKFRDDTALALFTWDAMPFIDKNRLLHLPDLAFHTDYETKNTVTRCMKILLAPDKFKGTLTASDVVRTLALALRESRLSDSTITALPLADGGEGTLEIYAAQSGAEYVTAEVHDPAHNIVNAQYVKIGETAIIELAQSSGHALTGGKRDVMHYDTFGTGELIMHAVQGGAKKLVIAIGGSATNDGGMGCARALGVRFFDVNNNEVTGVGDAMLRVSRIDVSGIPNEMHIVPITVLCDVENPLIGRTGATMVFSPQKGATRDEMGILELGMRNLSKLYTAYAGKNIADMPGSGAAGGTGAMLAAFFGAKLVSGIETILREICFEEKAKDADLIITGEGRLDSQTFSGKKAVAGVCAHAGKTPVVIVCGSAEYDAKTQDMPVMCTECAPIDEPLTREDAAERLYHAMRRVIAIRD